MAIRLDLLDIPITLIKSIFSKHMGFMKTTIRVRFAPAPTGMMHLGNIRTALMNYLFAQQKQGTFVLRIEDTDAERNFDPQAKEIRTDLGWLGLTYNEGPGIGGPYEPYFQSQRTAIYQERLNTLAKQGAIYRCFCTEEELERKRERQRALKLPPRYDRTCLALKQEDIERMLADKVPFIWRVKINHNDVITIHDLAHGNVRFEMKNFSDYPITRQDGSFTFIFANFVDDMDMKITHVFRGEDHLSNTANQAALYKAFNVALPIFWHMPIICNIDGKKLSKRDFGFSLRDLQEAGFLPEAIDNYLAILGSSFEQEIMSLDELATAMNFEKIHTTGAIRYDVEKLKWINHQWITKYPAEKLTQLCQPYLEKKYPEAASVNDKQLSQMIQTIKTDLITLQDCVPALTFYFTTPVVHKADLEACIASELRTSVASVVEQQLALITDSKNFVSKLKEEASKQKIPVKELFWFLRLALMDSIKGPAIHDLIDMLGTQEAKKRIEYAIKQLQTL